MTPTEPETIVLMQPVFDGPRIVQTLKMRAATTADVPFIAGKTTKRETAIRFAALLCGVPAYVIRGLDVIDGARVGEALNRQMLGAAFIR